MEMNVTMLGDSLFELADCWVPSIDASAYVDFLWKLYRDVVDSRGEWRDARACGYDGEIAAAADSHAVHGVSEAMSSRAVPRAAKGGGHASSTTSGSGPTNSDGEEGGHSMPPPSAQWPPYR